MFGDPSMKQLIKILLLSHLFIMIYDTNKNVLCAQDSGAIVDESEGSLSVENVHQINLDTADLQDSTSGNWLEKRIWFERAEKSFDEIRSIVSSVNDIRIQFSNEVNAVGQKIDTFFETVDFTKNQLEDTFKGILSSLETEQKLTGDLSEAERNLLEIIKKELSAIEQIGKDIKVIGDVDNKIDQTIMQAFKTIDECREYETKSWDTFKAIGKELDDKNARNLYYQMNNFKQNIEQKSSYLKTTLLPYLHNVLVAKIDTNIANINKTIDELKVKGLDIQKLMGKTQEDDLTEIEKNEKAAEAIAVQKALEQERAAYQKEKEEAAQKLEEERKQSFFYKFMQYYDASIGMVVKSVTSFFQQSLDNQTSDQKDQKNFVLDEKKHKNFMSRVFDDIHAWYTSLWSVADKQGIQDAQKIALQSSQVIQEKQNDIKDSQPAVIPAPLTTASQVSEALNQTGSSYTGVLTDTIATPTITESNTIQTQAAAPLVQAAPLQDNVVVQFLKKPAEQEENSMMVLEKIINFFRQILSKIYELLGSLLQSFLNFALQSTSN